MQIHQGDIYWVILTRPDGSEPGEANLPKYSVVEVSKLSTVDKAQLGEFIGSLTGPRIDQILAGIQFLQRLTEPGEMGREG